MEDQSQLFRVPKRSTDIVSRVIADQLVFIPLGHTPKEVSSLFAINEVGTRIWDLFDGKRSLNDVIQCLLNEYEVTREEAEKALVRFVKELEQIGAVEQES